MSFTMVEGLNLNCTCVLCLVSQVPCFKIFKNENTMTVSADLVFDPLSELLYHVLSLHSVVGRITTGSDNAVASIPLNKAALSLQLSIFPTLSKSECGTANNYCFEKSSEISVPLLCLDITSSRVIKPFYALRLIKSLLTVTWTHLLRL